MGTCLCWHSKTPSNGQRSIAAINVDLMIIGKLLNLGFHSSFGIETMVGVLKSHLLNSLTFSATLRLHCSTLDYHIQ
jgi:hypothetical protein